MTIKEMSERLEINILTEGQMALNNTVNGVYTCDLLSHAMAKVNAGEVWITVHTNLNVVAVASLTDASCVLIPEGIEVDSQTLQRAEEKGVAFLSSPLSAAHLCHKIISLLEGML